MISATILTMLENISQSLHAVQNLIVGVSYIFGITFVMYALVKFFMSTSQGANSQIKFMPPFYYLLGGVVLIYFPSSLSTMSQTFFGSQSSLLQYQGYKPYNVYDSIKMIIQTAGLLWFYKGTVFLIQSGDPNNHNQKQLPVKKGLGYFIASIFAVNFDYAVATCSWCIQQLIKWF